MNKVRIESSIKLSDLILHDSTYHELENEIVFLMKKRFNLNSTDGFHYYYHVLRKEEKVLSKRQMGDGSVMISDEFRLTIKKRIK